MPPEIQETSRSIPIQNPRPGNKLYAVFILCLLSAASFCIAFSYSAQSHNPAVNSAAAAAAADATTSSTPSPFAGLDLQAQAVYVEDMATGKVLYAKNADAQLPLASLTKIPMALAVVGSLPLDSTITLPANAPLPDGSTGLLKGQTWSVRDLLDFTLIVSSNDGAQILADAADSAIEQKYPAAPSTDATLWRMNQIARGLGLSQTYFLNVHGLDISPTQAGSYGSARDIGVLMAYAATSSPGIFAPTTLPEMQLTDAAGDIVTAHNTDDALSAIPGIIMGKTGFTDLAGGNLAVVFDAGPAHPVVAVVLHSTYDARFSDMKQIVDAASHAVQQE